MSKISCPSCNELDMVQKITSIMGGETHQTSGQSVTASSSTTYGGQEFTVRGQSGRSDYKGTGSSTSRGYSSSHTQISAQQQSVLAQMLTPPAKPAPPEEPTKKINTDGFGIIYVATGVIAFFVALQLTSGMWGEFGSVISALLLVCGLTVSAMIGVLVIGMKLIEKNTYPEEKWALILAEHNKKIQTYETEILPKWNKAIQRWNDAFYCRRCDKVYVPGEDQAREVGRLQELLFS